MSLTFVPLFNPQIAFSTQLHQLFWKQKASHLNLLTNLTFANIDTWERVFLLSYTRRSIQSIASLLAFAVFSITPNHMLNILKLWLEESSWILSKRTPINPPVSHTPGIPFHPQMEASSRAMKRKILGNSDFTENTVDGINPAFTKLIW